MKVMTHMYKPFSRVPFADHDAYHVPVLNNYVPAVKVWFDWMQKSISMLRSSSVRYKENCQIKKQPLSQGLL